MTREPRDLITMLADRGEEAISKLADTPGADRLLGAVQTMRERVDEMQRKLRGVDQLERRVATLERRLDELAAPSAAKKSPAKKTASRTPAKKSSASTTRKSSSSAETGSGSPG